MDLDSPFPHHGPLLPHQVRGRDRLLDELVRHVTAHRPTVLVAPRRFGKTSLLGGVEARLADTVTVVRVDFYELRSWPDFTARLASALDAVAPGHRGALERVAAGFDLNLGVVKASLQRPARQGADLTADRLLDVLVAHAASVPTVVMFDEFSSIGRVDGAAGLLRTKLQHHYHAVGLLFAGSEPSTMRLLFSGVDQPFYAQADLVEVPPLALAALVEIVDEGFAGHAPVGLASRIHAFTNGHPQRSMQLADAAWLVVQAGHPDEHAWADALERCRRATADGHETRFSSLPAAEQAVLRLAATSGVLFGQDAQLLSLSPSSAQRARAALVERGQLVVDDRGVHLVDPLYADWIRRRFPL